MADLPISFSGPMVRALLDGRKTQTRRLPTVPKALRSLNRPNRPEPRYRVGDRLYVREHWKTWADLDGVPPRDLPPSTFIYYLASPQEVGRTLGKLRQAMHMMRWSSRLFVVVTDVRLQPLHDITDEDCLAEGLQVMTEGDSDDDGRPVLHTYYRGADDLDWVTDPAEAYFHLLDSLHGEGFADSNPSLFAYSFTVHRGHIDAG